MKTITIIIAFFLTSTILSVNPDVADDIALAIKAGNAKELSKHFSANIDLNIPGETWPLLEARQRLKELGALEKESRVRSP